MVVPAENYVDDPFAPVELVWDEVARFVVPR